MPLSASVFNSSTFKTSRSFFTGNNRLFQQQQQQPEQQQEQKHPLHPIPAQSHIRRSSGAKPPLRQYSQDMTISNATGKFRQTIETFRKVRVLGLHPDILIYNSMLQALGELGKVEEMMNIYYEIKDRALYHSRRHNHQHQQQRSTSSSNTNVTYAATNNEQSRDSSSPPSSSPSSSSQQQQQQQPLATTDQPPPPLQPNILTFNLVLKGLVNTGDWGRADRIITDLTDVFHLTPNVFTFNHYFDICAAAAKFRPGFERYEQMVRMGVTPNVPTFMALINMSLHSRMGISAYEFLKEAENRGMSLKIEVYIRVLNALLKVEHAEGALYIANALEQRFRRHLDEGSQLVLMNVAAKLGRYDIAEEMWSSMENKCGIKLTSPMYHAMLHAYSRGGRIEEAFCTIHAMERDGIPIHYPATRQLVEVLASGSAEDIDNAYYMLVDMHKNYLAATNQQQQQQQQQQEQQQQQQPVNSSTTAGTTTTTDSANTTTTAGPTPTPVSSVDRVSIVSLNCIIDACAEINDLDRALATFSEISSVFGLEPDINTYNGLLESCARTRQISTAFRIYELLCKSASNGTCAPPNAETCRILVTTCIRSNNLERALDVLDECMRNGIRPTQATFIALIRYAVRSGGTDLVQKLEELMLQFGYDPVDHLQHYIDQYSDPASDHTHQRKQQQQYYRPQEEAEAEVAMEDDEEASN